jgi:signal transduction histidine kinase
MSTGSHFPGSPLQRPDVLGELLHSLSQPLTSLRCSLELSIDEAAEQQQKSVGEALQQTEQVIGMIQLMREYLDAEQPGTEIACSKLAPVLRSVTGDLSSIAALRDVRLRLVGTCAAELPMQESRLRLALQYLIGSMLEVQPVGGRVTLLLGEGPAGAVLRAEGELGFRHCGHGTTNSRTTRGPVETGLSLRRARLAIARRVLGNAGASLAFGDGDVDPATITQGFVLRIPRRL